MRVIPLSSWSRVVFRVGLVIMVSVAGVATPGFGADTDVDTHVEFGTDMDFLLRDKPIYTLWLEASYDTLDITDVYTELDVELPSGLAFQVGGGKTDYRFNDGFGDPINYHLGFSTARFERYVFGLTYEHWGVEDELLTDTFTADFSLNTTDWVLRLSPSYRDIELFSRVIRDRQFSVGTSSLGLEGEVIYFGIQNWALSATAAGFDYDNDITRLDSRLAFLRFNRGALFFSRGFLDKRYSGEIQHFFAWGSLGAEYGRSTSAVTETDADIIAGLSSVYLANRVTLYIEVGYVQPELLEDSTYTTLALSVQW